MPGIFLVNCEISSCSIKVDEMCREDGRDAPHLSADEETAAEESLSLYCKPVELYNILQRRAARNPLFLQRCLNYKMQVKHKQRIQLMVSLLNSGVEIRGLFPVYVLLARRISDNSLPEHSAVYRFSRASILSNFPEAEDNNGSQASFLLPEFHKLSIEAKSRSLGFLVVSFAGAQSSSHKSDLARGLWENVGGFCLVGQIPFESLYNLWEKSPNFNVGQKAELALSINVNSCLLKLNCFKEDKCVLIQFLSDSGDSNMPSHVKVNVTAEEVGSRDRSPYNLYSCSSVSSSLSNIIRLRAGNVIFNYRYYNNKMQKTEVTEDFCCPFCLVKCASFKGLRFHLCSSHDLFNYEFWVSEEFQAVTISLKAECWRSELVTGSVDPKQQTFCFCSKKRNKLCEKNVHTKSGRSHIFQTNIPSGICELHDRTYVQSSSNADYGQSLSCNNTQPPVMLPFSNARKLSIERSDLRNKTLLHKRQFFHSHRAQPMAIEQVLSDQDSEDEVDDDVADIEDRRMLDDFVDVTKEEKQIMHLWNSFVRKQRVLADGHIPWACEAFSRLHVPDLVQTPTLLWCWRLFMIKLWNHGLLDARTMNTCNLALEQFQSNDTVKETDL